MSPKLVTVSEINNVVTISEYYVGKPIMSFPCLSLSTLNDFLAATYPNILVVSALDNKLVTIKK